MFLCAVAGFRFLYYFGALLHLSDVKEMFAKALLCIILLETSSCGIQSI